MPNRTTTVESVAAIYDLHGNLPALHAVFAEIERIGPELIVVGGDIATGPMPRHTIDAVMALGDHAPVIRGNADRELVAFRDALDRGDDPGDSEVGSVDIWSAGEITREQRDWLAALPETVSVEIAGLGRTLFCNCSPRSDEEIITAISPVPRLVPLLAAVDAELIVCGHTHVQFDRAVAGKRIVNVGSVGMPYEGTPGAYWALLGPMVELRRTAYDFAHAAELVRKSGMPGADEYASENILTPPTAADATTHFERLAAAQ